MTKKQSIRFVIGVLLMIWVLSCGTQGIILRATVFRATAQIDATPTPLPLYALPDARLNRAFSSGSIALLSDGRTLVAANMINHTATIAVPSQNRVIAEIAVGIDPRGVAVTVDDARAVITNRASGTLSIIDVREAEVTATVDLGGVFPYGVVVGDNRTAYVSLLGSDEIAEVDLDSATVISRIPVPAAPAGLALWGEFLYVSHFWSGDLSLIYLPQRRVVETLVTGADTGLFQAVELDITRGLAYLPQTRSNAQNLALTYDSIAFPVVNVIDLDETRRDRTRQIALDTADRPVNMPFASALDRFSQRLYVANAGSNDVSVIDLTSGRARANIPVGSNPRGILLNRDNTLLYVHNALDATITTISTDTLEIQSVQPISNLTISVDVLLGAQLFYGADDPRMSAQPSVSCANCHFDGLSDGRVWRGFHDGARNTPLLFALPETPPYNWSATWLELNEVEYKIRDLQGGLGLIASDNIVPSRADLTDPLMENDLSLLTTYLTSLIPPSADFDPADAALIARGAEVFEEQNCADCHIGVVGTNLQAYDVGTGILYEERRGTAYDTPSLRWLRWSAPYFHDGSALTLREVFALPGTHQLIYDVTPADLDALTAYLLTLPTSE